MTGCSGKLRVQATAMCIIIKSTYTCTRCLLNTIRVAESNGLFSILRKFSKLQYVLIYLAVLTHVLCTPSIVLFLSYFNFA